MLLSFFDGRVGVSLFAIVIVIVCIYTLLAEGNDLNHLYIVNASFRMCFSYFHYYYFVSVYEAVRRPDSGRQTKAVIRTVQDKIDNITTGPLRQYIIMKCTCAQHVFFPKLMAW